MFEITKTSNRQKNIDRFVRGVLFLCSLVAIFTTIGIVASVHFSKPLNNFTT